MSRPDDQQFARAWFAAGRTADYVCPQCGASPADFSDRCTASLEAACPGFRAVEKAHAEFDAHWERRMQ